MFNFEKGDHVAFVYGSVLSPNPDGIYQAVVNGGEIIARKGCGSSGGPEYRVAGFSGWWAEENLVLVSRGTKNSPGYDEAVDPDTNTLKVENVSESKNKAFWKESCIPGEYMCSNCSCFAMHKSDGTESPTKFCPHCGELMTNWEDFV